MKALRYLLYTIYFTFTPIIAQDCYYFHEYQCKFPDKTFYLNGQSRSALFTYGMVSQFKMVTFGGEDYHISICYQFKVKNVRLRLIEDNDDKTVLYDNSENKYATEVSFSNNIARKIIVEISIPDEPNVKDRQPQCVGVLIHSRKTFQEPKNKLGF